MNSHAQHSREFLCKLSDEIDSEEPEQLTAALFCEIVPTAAHFSQAIAIAFNHYLKDENAEGKKRILELAASNSSDANAKISEHIRHALCECHPL